MSDKKQKTQKEQQTHIFEIHTMASDNAKKQNSANQKAPLPIKNSQQKTATPKAAIPVAAKIANNNTQKNSSINKATNSDNPFLSENKTPEKNVKKASFAPGKKKEPVEKINYTPADIAPKDKKEKSPKKSPKKMMNIIMFIFIVIFLLGAVGFGIFMLKSNDDPQVAMEQDIENMPIDTPINPDEDMIIADEPVDPIDSAEPVEQTYSTELPNYFSIDIESLTTETDIANELDLIATNMQKNDIEGPVSFIVTDKNSNPVSFHVFAMSAGMDIAQDILTSLEEGFEIYAYSDGPNGIRFGFAVDAKKTDSLQTSLTANEAGLPASFDIMLNGFGKTATDVVFSDGTYGTHPIRFYNLTSAEVYSVDYTINDRRFVIGSTKDTIRAIIDYLKEAQMQQVTENGI